MTVIQSGIPIPVGFWLDVLDPCLIITLSMFLIPLVVGSQLQEIFDLKILRQNFFNAHFLVQGEINSFSVPAPSCLISIDAYLHVLIMRRLILTHSHNVIMAIQDVDNQVRLLSS